MLRLASLVVFIFAALPSVAVADDVELVGSVRLPDGEPAVGAVVRVVENFPDGTRGEDVVGDDGTFRISELNGENFSVRVEADGMAPETRIDVGAQAELDFVLEPGARFSGVVLDARSGTPVKGATVFACDRQSGRFGIEACSRALSDEDGLFRFNDLAPGVGAVMAYSPRHAQARPPSVTVPPETDPDTGEPAVLEIRLDPGARVSGSVFGPDETPIAKAEVYLIGAAGELSTRKSWQRRERTEDDGSFTFVGVPLGTNLHLRAEFDGYARASDGPHTVEQGDHLADVSLTLDAGTTLEFRLVDEDDRPVALSGLVLQPKAEGTWQSLHFAPEQVQVDAEGRHTLEHLPTGLYDFELEPVDHLPLERDDIKLAADGPTDLGTLVARTGATVSGRVTDTQGVGLAVTLTANFRGTPRIDRSDEDGRYRLVGLPEGRTVSISVSPGPGFLHVKRSDVETGRDDVDFVLERSATVIGRVVTYTGEPPEDYKVRAHEEAGSDESDRLERVGYPQLARLPEGHFKLSELRPGRFTVLATSDAWAPARKTGVVLEEGQEIDVGILQLGEGLMLEGRVLGSRADVPVAGAEVTLSTPGAIGFGTTSTAGTRTSQSGIDGRFVFRGLEPGSLQVKVEHPGFSPMQQNVVLDEDGSEEIEIRLNSGGTLTGTVTDAEGEPVSGIEINAVVPIAGERDRQAAFTDSEGRYTIERVPAGSCMVMRVSRDLADGFGAKQATIVDGETTVVNFTEQTRILLTGRVLRGEEPVSADLLFFPRPEDKLTLMSGSMKTTRSDENGSYSIGLEAPGPYQVMVSGKRSGFGSEKVVEILVADEGTVHRDIVLSTTSISGSVTGADGAPISGASVTATLHDVGLLDMTGRTMTRTDGAGRYSMTGLAAGTYSMSASVQGRPASEKPSVVANEGANTIDFVLERGLKLRGRVLDPAGRPVAEATVMLAPAGSMESYYHGSTRTDINGAFEISAPERGAVDLSALSMAWAPGLLFGVDASTLPDDYEAVIRLTRGGTVVVRLVGSDGSPAVGVQIAALPAEPTLLGSIGLFLSPPLPSGADGILKLERLPQGSYVLQVAGRPDVQNVTVEVIDGDVREVTMQIP